ncbi:salicylate hydroxylase [Actinopolyspora erythraea]|uniref:Salicylate hydroxylase n=1 Tax=Actinopolyspora erythraea TaxID=414996 RepID=A0A099D0F0_9ACTN|nr:3-hydroxybenzoate 6-monooxygenase [Actinopolyspora erythraea]ASU79657.1 salicylate hydroxylase [Actinopolyspora erythraea]KGI79416.1 salicylate hydroxylase [Actinopolyspora erythraea]
MYIAVAGGGIGGLATALAAAEQGHEVVVLERRETFTELGAGIQLGPNAFHALDCLGVGERVRELAVHIAELRFMDGVTGEAVARMPVTGSYRERFDNPYAVVHRIDIYRPLLDACRASDAIELRPNAAVTHYEHHDQETVVAVLESGQRIACAALIGADGIRSSVRGQLVGDGAPRISGHTIYRSVIPMEQVPPELRWNSVTLWAGPKSHFVHYPIGGGELLNLAVTRDNDAAQEVVGEPVERDLVLSEFPEFTGDARRLLELGSDWKSWVLCDRDPVERWADDRVLLVGDAAHPMLQYAAQGACMALEDAVVLGGLLDCSVSEVPGRLETFNEQRRSRTAWAQFVSREMGRQLYHPEGEAATERNAMLRGLSTEQLHDKVAWLHGTRVGEAAFA